MGINVGQQKRTPDRFSNIEGFSVAVTTTRTRGGNLERRTALCRYNAGFLTEAASFTTLTHTLQQFRPWWTDLEPMWSDCLIAEPQSD